jgi:hypothetical protein
MLKLPPPVWARAYTFIAIGASYLLGWPQVPGLPLVWPGVVLVVLGFGLSVTSAMQFAARAPRSIRPHRQIASL